MADDLISRQKIINLLELLARHEDDFRQSVILGVVHTIKHVPAVDAVEVVRCGECIHRHEGLRPNCHGRRPDWFCADGIRRPGAERREENEP